MKVACKHYSHFCSPCLNVPFSEHVVTWEDVKALKQRLTYKLYISIPSWRSGISGHLHGKSNRAHCWNICHTICFGFRFSVETKMLMTPSIITAHRGHVSLDWTEKFDRGAIESRELCEQIWWHHLFRWIEMSLFNVWLVILCTEPSKLGPLGQSVCNRHRRWHCATWWACQSRKVCQCFALGELCLG